MDCINRKEQAHLEEKLNNLILNTLVENHVYTEEEKKHINKIIDNNDDFDFFDDLEMDSIDIVNLIVKTEEEFGISLSDDDALMGALSNYKDFLDFLSKKAGN